MRIYKTKEQEIYLDAPFTPLKVEKKLELKPAPLEDKIKDLRLSESDAQLPTQLPPGQLY